VSVWEGIYKAIAWTIKEEDKSFELAYLRFGEARKWVAQNIDLNPNWLVLEIGCGQGYFTMELASPLRKGEVISIDRLNARSTTKCTRYIAKQLGIKERIGLIACDSTRLPFKSATFDVVASFLVLQDIKNTRGDRGVLATIDEACRVVKRNGIVAIADDSFLTCKPEGEQGRLFEAIKRYWRKLLPSTRKLVNQMKKKGVSEVKVLPYDPKENLPPRDAERELRLSVEWAKPLGIEADFDNFWKEVGELVRKQGRIFSQVVLLIGTKDQP